MLSQETEERLANHLSKRIEETNTFILQKIGEAIKQMSTLTPSQAYQLGQILKYGGSYEEIAKQLAKMSGKSAEEIYKIFDEVAKGNLQFAKQFYKYRNMDFIPYEKNIFLQQQVRDIATLTANTYKNIANTTGIGFLFRDNEDNLYFKDLKQAYNEIIDRGILAISQGKTTFQEEMRKVINDIGNNGVVKYESGKTRRLDSAARMNLLDGVRQLNNEMSIQFGKEFDADGVEISVHSNPAPDHADIQGRQFSNEEYENLEAGLIAKDYKGNTYDGADKRHISEYNCYHTIYPIILGVSKPMYTDKQLKKIQDINNKGFMYNGKKYTMYQGTQMQRRLETEIRKQKERQILAKASGDDFNGIVYDSQSKITQLTHKYDKLCKASGLQPVKQRMAVSGYKRTNVNKLKNSKLSRNEIIEKLKNKDITVMPSVLGEMSELKYENPELIDKNLQQLDKLSDKYKHNKITPESLRLRVDKMDDAVAYSSDYYHEIVLNYDQFKSKEILVDTENMLEEHKWHNKIDDKNKDVYTITHEYGHIVEFEYLKGILSKKAGHTTFGSRAEKRELDASLRATLLDRAIKKSNTKITRTEIKRKYWSDYANSKRNFEWFAEAFAECELSNNSNIWLETFREWLNENI